jgi:hypothetical protein
MLWKIMFVAVLVGAALVLVKQEQLLEKAGLVGYCEVVRPPPGEEGEWHGCHEGLMSGYPNLVKDSCEREGRRPGIEYWRCPVSLQSGPPGA